MTRHMTRTVSGGSRTRILSLRPWHYHYADTDMIGEGRQGSNLRRIAPASQRPLISGRLYSFRAQTTEALQSCYTVSAQLLQPS